MRLLPASLALLGVEVAMADHRDLRTVKAVIATTDHATPTRPRAALGLQETRRIAQAEPTAAAATIGSVKLQLLEKERLQQQQEGQTTTSLELLWHQEAKRQDSMSSSVSAPVVSEPGNVYGTSTTPSGPVTTSLAFFTAGGGEYSVSSLAGGINVVAGKTVSVGGADALVGGVEVSAAPSGLIVDGVEVEFETVTISASVSSVMVMTSSSAAAEGSASEAAAAASQSSSTGNGAVMPMATGGVQVVAAVGAMAGALFL